MIIEMRTYTLKPGSVPVVEQRFGKALPARVKFSRLAAFWHTEVGPLNQVIHVWPYDSLAHREQARAAAAKVEDWPPNIREFIVDQKSEIMTPAPFSPPLDEERAYGNLYEIRTYTYQPGTMPTVIQRWSEKIEERVKLSPLVGAWYTDLGALNRWVHVWAYKDYAERECIRRESFSSKKWPPATGEFLIKMENMLVAPAPFSPLR
ncbi:MAG: NIPSNAP family protein [Candidatus Binataceae bacterium]